MFRAILDLASARLAASLLLLGWAPVAVADEQVSFYAEAKLTAADGAPGDRFGDSVATSGDTVVIGAYADDDHGNASGSAYVFERDPLDPNRWIQTAKLTANDGAIFDGLGWAVAIADDTAVIGAPFDDDLGSDSGSAYVFERDPLDPSRWIQTAKLTANDGAAFDKLGRSVAIAGDTVVIGAHDDLGSDSGSAYVFERDPLEPNRWIQTAKLTAPEPRAGDFFGVSVAVSGDTAVIGSRGEQSGYVFERDPLDRNRWIQTSRLSTGGLVDSITISGDTVVIGNNNGGFFINPAYVFQRDPLDPNRWIRTAELSVPDALAGDLFGSPVAISGDTAVIGAYLDDAYLDDDLGVDSGSAYLFERDPLDPNRWIQTAKLSAPDGAPGTNFGVSVAIAGDTVVIGAHDSLGSDPGSAYVFRRTLVDPALALSGDCPREVVLDGSGLTPRARVYLWGGPGEGLYTILDGPCVGHELGIANARLVRQLQANAEGGGNAVRTVAENRCGWYLQLLDLTSCAVSEVVPLP